MGDLKCAASLSAMVDEAGVSPQRCLGSRFYANEEEKYHFPDQAVRQCESHDFRDIPKFVITLDRNGTSVSKFHERAAKVGFGDVCRVQAVPGRECLANTETYPRMPSDPLAPAIGISHMKIMRHLVDNNIAGGICISHLRALHECVAENPDANTIIIMEGDVTANQNTHQLMSAFLANWHGNEALKNTKY